MATLVEGIPALNMRATFTPTGGADEWDFEILDIDWTGANIAVIETSGQSLGALGVKKFQAGLQDLGELAITAHWNPENGLPFPWHTNTKREGSLVVTFPDATPTTATSGESLTFATAFVSGWSMSAKGSTPMTCTITFKLSHTTPTVADVV